MKYDIRDIGDAGLQVDRSLDLQSLRALLLPVGVEPAPETGQVRVQVRLHRVETSGMGGGVAVSVQGTVTGHFTVPCARCLAPATVTLDEPEVQLTFLPPSAVPTAKEELTEEDLDTLVHDGQQIDLEPVVREQLVLAIPITPLCREDCRGICTSCGADLNQETCSCEQAEAPLSPWVEALSRLKAGGAKKRSG